MAQSTESAQHAGPSRTDLSDKTALVTGAASGLGKAIAQQLAAAGASVIVADRDGDAAAEVANGLAGQAPGSGVSWQVDLSDTEALDGGPITVDGREQAVDILVNNAGIQRIHPLEEFPLAEWQLINRLMLESPFVLTKAVLPGMYARGWGRIINISSAHGLRASAFKSAYVAAKHGIMGLTKTTALEAGPKGVTCNAINPGYVMTPLVAGQVADQAATRGIAEDQVLQEVFLQRSAVPELVTPEAVGQLALFLCSDAARFINGTDHAIDGGWTAE